VRRVISPPCQGGAGGGFLALLAMLAFCSACARGGQARTLIKYQSSQPLGRVRVEAVNATGRELPLPPPGLIEQAVRVVTQQPEIRSSISDAFAHAAAERLASISVIVEPDSSAPLLRISLERWDLRDGEATGAVVFVSADYELLDDNGLVLWEVKQERQPVRLSGPNLSRYEVARVARTCVDDALASLPARETRRP